MSRPPRPSKPPREPVIEMRRGPWWAPARFVMARGRWRLPTWPMLALVILAPASVGGLVLLLALLLLPGHAR